MATNNVREVGSNKGRVFVVDPNPPGLDVIPPEDMFIYVKFSAYPRSRTTYGGNTLEGDPIVFDSGIEGEVHFISTKISYKDGKLDPQLQKTYATTDWTNIGGFKNEDTRSEGVLEGFGIKSIDIKYNASLVPVVDITFTDVRGAGLFDVIKDNDRKSPYSIFFKMPYPVFRLSVKGYFGQKVDYCLHMVNWTSNFDGSTGNFDITANFLGFQQAFLNDMVIGNIIGAVNTQKGFNNLNRIYDESESDIGTLPDGRNIRKLDEFFTKISRIQVDSEIIKSELSSFEYLKDLNGKLSILKSIRTFIGTQIGKQPISNSNGTTNNGVSDSTPYIELENNNTRIFTSPIKDNNLQNNRNYLSVRDYIIFNSINRTSFKSYIETLNDIIKKYVEFLDDADRKEFKPENSLKGLSDKVKLKIKKIPSDENKITSKDRELIDSFPLSSPNESESWERYISTKNIKTNKPEKIKLETIVNGFTNENSIFYLKKDWDTTSEKNSNFQISLLSNTDFYKTLKKETTVLVADFRKQRELVEGRIIELETIIKEQRENVQLEINDRLLKNFRDLFGFNPTIDNCFEILTNNTQAMVETVYDISAEAEQKSKSENRTKILSSFETDVPTGINSVAWPTVYQRKGDGSLEEIYIGEIGSINSVDFPEWKFTEEVFEILVAKEKELDEISKASVLKNGLDTDNWFPINPIDYEINPWIKLNVLNDKKEILEELAKQIFFRIALLVNYSMFDVNTGLSQIDKYVNFESIAANKTIFSKNVRGVISNILKEIKDKKISLKDTDFFKNNIDDEGAIFYLKEDNNILPEYNNFVLSGKYSDKATYILFDDTKIINNTKKLFKEIKEEKDYTTLTDPNAGGKINKLEKGDVLFYQNKYSTANNFNTNNIFNVWLPSVNKNLFISSSNQIKDNLNDTKLIDFNPSGDTYGSEYLNITNFNLNISTTCNFEDIMTQSELYSNQPSNYARALLLLSTFPFRTFKDGFLNSIFPNNTFSGARVVKLPSLYVYFIGGLLWRYENGLNGLPHIDFTIFKNSGSTCPYTDIVNSPYDRYLNLGVFKKEYTSEQPLEDSLKALPTSVKKTLIDKFKNWVDTKNRFNDNLNGDFELNITYYVNDGSPNGFSSTITDDQKTKGESYIFNELKQTTDLIILNPSIFNPNKIVERLSVESNEVESYISAFSLKFDEIENNNTNGSDTNTEEEKQSNNKSTLTIKLGIYNYFKNIKNKWVGSEKKSFNICGGSDTKDLFDYFRFVDRGWADIGDKATFNLKSFLTLGSNLNTSVYFFMSKLLRDSNFLFQILPTYINYTDREEVAKIFQPQTNLKNNESSGPIFCCIYIGGASEVLDIEERNNYYFKNDGFTFDENGNEIPADMQGNEKNSLVAFRVSFGAQNQTIFKNVSLNQQEHKETGEYFRALSDLVDKRGGTQKTYVGTDLLRLFKTRSYTCKVDALGCMNIQPLMYFDLQNVPFFNGAYLITSVNHNISPNHMTTNFQGVRQSKFISPPTEEITADLDIDLNESSETPKIVFTNLDISNSLYNIGVRNEIEPDDTFDFDVNFTGGKLKTLGVIRNNDAELDQLAVSLTEIFKQNDLLTNAQVTMAFTAMLANSNNLNSKEKEVEKGVEIRDENNNILYYTTDISSINDRIIDKYKDSYLSSIPLESPVDNSKTAYTLKGNPNLDESDKNDEINKSKETIQNKINNLDNTDSNYDKDKKLLEDQLKEVEKREDELINLPYYNIFKGDAYRFRPRGYLYLIGRKNYYDLNIPFGNTVSNDLIINPDEANLNEIRTIKTSILVWKNLKDSNNKTAYSYSSIKNDGSSATFKKCLDIVYQGFGPSDDISYGTFESVLTTFFGKDNEPLIDFDNPRGGL